MDAFEVNGQWWLPETPDKKVSGTLAVDDKGKAELRLIGALRPYLDAGESETNDGVTTVSFTEESMAKSGIYPRILGHAGQESFTLDDCLQVHRSGGIFGGLETERVIANQVFRGAIFDAGEPLEFHRINVSMDWLAYWVVKSAIQETVQFKGSEEEGYDKHLKTTLTIAPLDSESCAGVDGSTVTLGQTYGIAGDAIRERSLTQDFYFSVQVPEVRPLSEVLELASDLQNLVSVGTGRNAAFSSIDLRHPDLTQKIGDKSREVPVEMFAQWHLVSGAVKTLLTHEMYFTLDHLGGLQGVERWLPIAARHRSALNRVAATRYMSDMFVSDRLINCAAALEAYDREKHQDDIYFADRLRRSAALAGAPFEDLVGDVEAWVKAVKQARNDVAHHNAAMTGGSTAHLVLSGSAYWLFQLCLLRDSAAPAAVFDHIPQHGEFRWLSRRHAEVLGTGSAAT